jgi:hypothetical protein
MAIERRSGDTTADIEVPSVMVSVISRVVSCCAPTAATANKAATTRR